MNLSTKPDGDLPPSHSSYRSFSYLTADKSDLYKAVMVCFLEAKGRFLLHLRSIDLAKALNEHGLGEIDSGELDRSLKQLCDWGNIERHPDLTEVTTVEEFSRPRYLYQMTPMGEATEVALQTFLTLVGRRGELQAAALGDIRDLLRELVQLAKAPATATASLDLADREARILRTMTALCQRFEDLTSRAQAFLTSIMRPGDLYQARGSTFLAYKDMLIGYIERFIGELARTADVISGLLREMEASRLEELIGAAADRELIDSLEKTPAEVAAVRARWLGRWRGLRSWFIGQGADEAQVQILRERARAAIRNLVQAIQYLNDRHMTRTDRVADLRVLARWFAEAPTDADAHRLWRVAFALSPARHLGIDGDSLNAWDEVGVGAQTPWSEAPPLVISPRLRRSGHYKRRGRIADIVDRSVAKADLEALAERERRQLEAAIAQLATAGPRRLSELGPLGAPEFDLFLDLLGEALASNADPGGEVWALSADGSLEVVLTPARDGRRAVIQAAQGTLDAPDHWIEIIPAGTRSRRSERARSIGAGSWGESDAR